MGVKTDMTIVFGKHNALLYKIAQYIITRMLLISHFCKVMTTN